MATLGGLWKSEPPACADPTYLGTPCFRPNALPLFVVVTDAPFHNGPRGVPPIDDYEFAGPHRYDEALAALRAAGVLVIGLGASDPGAPAPLPHLRALARDTGALDADGDPLAFDIGARGEGIDRGIVRAIERLAASVPLDVDAIVQDVSGDAFDARAIVRSVRPLRADPPSGVRAIEESRFVGVSPGTRVTFELTVDASGLPAADSTRRIPARIIFRAFGRSRLGSVDVTIVIPGTDGGGCDGHVASEAT
jgi:hypothetical protein